MVRQAVILAGGKGSRLGAITRTIPKPMVSIYKKPFLEHLILQIKSQGIRRILLLTGYLSSVIEDYFKDGKQLGVEITYSNSDVEFETGKRLIAARDLLEEHFLLLYCDNYCPVNFQKMLASYKKKPSLAQILVYKNLDGYSKDNVVIDGQGKIVLYDKGRSMPNLQGVDIGYAIMNKSVLDYFCDGNENFEKVVYPRLVEKEKLYAYLTEHRYYSIGSKSRLPLTESFFSSRPAIFLDRDGVINKKSAKGEYVKSWHEFRWLDGAKEALILLTQNKFRIIIITNQAGIARGHLSEKDLQVLHENMRRELHLLGVEIHAFYYCPHGWDENCSCRKPKPGMLYQAQKDYNLDLSKTPFIGDDERDISAGKSAGSPTYKVDEKHSLIDIVNNEILKNAKVLQR